MRIPAEGRPSGDRLKRSLFGPFQGTGRPRRTPFGRRKEGPQTRPCRMAGSPPERLPDNYDEAKDPCPWPSSEVPPQGNKPSLCHNRTGCSKSWQDCHPDRRLPPFTQSLVGIGFSTQKQEKNAKKTRSALHSRHTPLTLLSQGGRNGAKSSLPFPREGPSICPIPPRRSPLGFAPPAGPGLLFRTCGFGRYGRLFSICVFPAMPGCSTTARNCWPCALADPAWRVSVAYLSTSLLSINCSTVPAMPVRAGSSAGGSKAGGGLYARRPDRRHQASGSHTNSHEIQAL
jgi:hypothetical protein